MYRQIPWSTFLLPDLYFEMPDIDVRHVRPIWGTPSWHRRDLGNGATVPEMWSYSSMMFVWQDWTEAGHRINDFRCRTCRTSKNDVRQIYRFKKFCSLKNYFARNIFLFCDKSKEPNLSFPTRPSTCSGKIWARSTVLSKTHSGCPKSTNFGLFVLVLDNLYIILDIVSVCKVYAWRTTLSHYFSKDQYC